MSLSETFTLTNTGSGPLSTNVWLRILHNRTMDLGWLLSPVLNKRVWPRVKYKSCWGITAEEHPRVLASENLEDYRQFFRLLWETGGSQTDIVNLTAEDVDWPNERLGKVTFGRKGRIPVADGLHLCGKL